MEWQFESLKIVVPAVLGFFFGRLQTSYTDRVGRTKDIQNELLRSIRLCTSSAIDYHSRTLAKDLWLVKAVHLKNQLLRIRTDVFIVKNLCKRKDERLQLSLLDFFDAITEFPFEANELPEKIDSDRFARISLTGEKLVQELTTCSPRIF